MSILIAVVKSDYIALCTDCQHTDMETGLPVELNYKKIECFSPKLYIAHGGSAYISNKCMQLLQLIYQDGDISDDVISDIVQALIKAYENVIQKEPKIEDKITSKFIVAGYLDKETMGLSIIENSSNGIVFHVVEGTDKPQIVLFQPADMSYSECFNIIVKEYNKIQPNDFHREIETVLRKAVILVSNKSRFVSEESIFYSISKN